ncbi:MAG: ATP-binding protein [Candidatus Poribacteria bacterium]
MTRRESDIEAPRDRVQAALAGAVHDSLRPVLIAVAVLYVGFAVSHWFSLPRPQGAYVAGLELVSVAVALALWRFVGAIARPSSCTYPIAVAINLLMLANVYTRVLVLRDAHQGITLLPLFVGIGFFFLSTPWMGVVLAAAISGWALAAIRVGQVAEVMEHRFALLAAAILAVVIHVVRVRILTRVENLRYADKLRATELQRAVEDSDQSRMRAETAGRELRKSLEDLGASEARYRDLFENAHDLIASFYPDGRFAYANAAWSATLGYGEEELLTLHLSDIVSPGGVDQVTDVMERLVERPSGATVECDLVTKSGRSVSVEGRLSARTNSDAPVTVRGIFRDVTQRREIERLKDEFIATVSHELRTPLTSIQGALELVTDGLAGDLPEAAEHLLTIACGNGRRLVKLVNDILDISNIEAGEMAFRTTTVEVAALVRIAADANDNYARQHGCAIQIEGELPPRVYVTADPERLLQVLANLLSNAAKFSPPDTDITLSVKVHASTVRIGVRNAGEGLPQSAHGVIFDRFMQLDASSARAQEGAGLGLAISKAIVDRLHGQIGFDSTVGEGVTFHVTLPTAPPPDPSATLRNAVGLRVGR